MFPAQFVFKVVDALFFSALYLIILSDKCRGAIFKKLLLPAIEDLRLKMVFVTEIGYRYPVNQMPLEYEYLFFWGVIVSFLAHGLPSVHDGLSQTG